MPKKYGSMADLFVAVGEALRDRGAPPGIRLAAEEMAESMDLSAPEGASLPVYVPGYRVVQRFGEEFPQASGDRGKVDDAELEGFVSRCVDDIVERYSHNWLKMADSSALDRTPQQS